MYIEGSVLVQIKQLIKALKINPTVVKADMSARQQ